METTRAPADPPVTDSGQYVLRLYVVGNSGRSIHAIANIKTICELYLKERYQLEVIDLYLQPERARGDQIVAIPTLVKVLPLPSRRIIGDLADTKQICISLDISEQVRADIDMHR
jgi:circadian clock protein KaiB